MHSVTSNIVKAWVQISMQLFQGHRIKFVAVQADPKAHEDVPCCKEVNSKVHLYIPHCGFFTNLCFDAFCHVKYGEDIRANKHANISRTKDDICYCTAHTG